MKSRLLVGVLLAGALFAHHAAAFECPKPELTSPGVLSQTPEQQKELATALSAPDIEDQIGIAVSTLQKKYPTVSDTELVNYLVGAYCPIVAGMSGLSDTQKTGKVEHFASTVFELLSEQKL